VEREAMKRLYLLRHGVAIPHGTPGIAEHDRPLTPAGEKRIRQVARGLRSLGLGLDKLVTSPLPRAHRTAELVAAELGLAHVLEIADVLRADSSAERIRDWLDGRGEQRLMVVGHDPSLSELLGLLATGGAARTIGNLRKGGVAALVGADGGFALDWLARPRLLRQLT
jgi:phosphohistidine phosphatase